MSGAPGSGVSTLARPLSERLRLPLVDKDVLRERTLFPSPGEELTHAPWGPGRGGRRDWTPTAYQAPELLPIVLKLQKALVEPMDLNCPILIVNASNSYQPSLPMVEEQLRAIVSSPPYRARPA
jgi:hypothetical protein